MRLLFLVFCFFSIGGAPIAAQVSFTKITDTLNPVVTFANTQASYKGAAWIDLDGDDFTDLYVAQKALFRNLGGGHFERLPDMAVALGQQAAGGSWGDIDNDGDADMISASTTCSLHIHMGADTFAQRNDLLPDFDNYRGWDCVLVDADNNGRLDLFWAHADNFPPGSVQQPCKMYLQGADGSFSPVTGYEFAAEFKPYTIPVWTDYDLDGDRDLFIGTGPGGSPGPDFCYKNLLNETGAFSLQRITEAPFNALQDGQVYNAIDYDNDGDMDICLTNYAGAKTRFYVNNGGEYLETETPFTLQWPLLTNAWADLDHDGDQDVLITRDGSTDILYYENTGGAFAAAQVAGSVPADANACGIALADYDLDGDQDFYVNGRLGGRSLYRNDQNNGRHWTQFSLRGVESNRSAIGAILHLRATIDGVPVWQIREVSARNSFQSQHDLRQHFGLGDAEQADSLIVRWPSGLRQVFTGLPADQIYHIVEGEELSGISDGVEPVCLHIAPNPSRRGFHVSAPAPIRSVQLADGAGGLLPLTVQFKDHEIHGAWPAGLPAGVYYLEVRLTDGRTTTQAVVKQ